MANTQVVTVDFHGQQILAVKTGNDIRVSVASICNNIGLQVEAQRKRIYRHHVLNKGQSMMEFPSSGGVQTMLTLPINMIPGWLFGVDVNRVNETARPVLIQYQEECFDVLWRYFSEGIAINQNMTITPEMQSDLQAIVATISPDGKRRGMVWSRFNNHFKIAKYNQLPAGQFDDAKRYLIDTFLDGHYVEEYPLSIYDIKAALSNIGSATIERSKALQSAVDKKAIELGYEFVVAVRQHMESQIANTCEMGSPRCLNEEKAMRYVEQCTLDSTLSDRYMGLLNNMQIMADSLVMMSKRYSLDIKEVLGHKRTALAIQ